MLDQSPRHIVAASALIRNQNREIALVKTERRGWELPGGQVELGETLTEGLRREILEECGIEVEIGRLAHVRSNLSSHIVILCFYATYVRGELRPSEETPQVRWADQQTVIELITHPALSSSLRGMLKNEGQILYQAYQSSPFALMEERAI